MKILKLSQTNSVEKREVTAQDYSGYFSGEAPEYQGSYIGSPSVDISDLSSPVGDVQKSVDLVNRFDASLLKNIAYMFNFSKPGVYGVYVPELDRAVKTKELEKRLRGMGYDIVDEGGMMKAYPLHEEKDSATIESEIQSVYDELESKGGSILGLNINDTQNEMEQSFSNLQEMVPPEMHNELRSDLMIAHMAATMAHEATHAHGHEDEGAPTQVETSLLSSAMNEIKTKYNIEGELNLKRGSTNNWYKLANAPFYSPSGSDLNGRHGGDAGQDFQGQPDWGLMHEQYANRAIEEMLSDRFMSPLPTDLSQENDSYELQLRKYTRDDFHLDPKLIFDELLRDSRLEDDTPYKSLEQLLEDGRPQPLMMPIKQASKMYKEATVFGWMNNLEISDGSTIPGLGDRVMAWDDRDESFVEEESWIKQQPRYNPTYDVKGFYYRWIEPRFKPELWDNYTRDFSNTHPARRFASKNDLGFIVDSLARVRADMLKGKYKATRFICTEDMLTVIDKCLFESGIDIDIFSYGELNDEEIYSCWIYKDADPRDVTKVEKAIQNNDEYLREMMSELIGCNSTLADAVKEIMDCVKEQADDYELFNVYAIGSYAREIALGEKEPEVEELEFTSDTPTDCLKLGYLIAESLRANVHLDQDRKCVCFNYKGVQVCFNGGKRIPSISNLMLSQDLGDSSSIMHDVCNKDFTINMRAYSPVSGKVTSIFGDDDVIKTLFEPDQMVMLSPFIILRAINLSVKNGLEIDESLENAMRKYAYLLLDRYQVETLQFAKNKIELLGKEEVQEAFKKYGLDQILDFGE